MFLAILFSWLILNIYTCGRERLNSEQNHYAFHPPCFHIRKKTPAATIPASIRSGISRVKTGRSHPRLSRG